MRSTKARFCDPASEAPITVTAKTSTNSAARIGLSRLLGVQVSPAHRDPSWFSSSPSQHPPSGNPQGSERDQWAQGLAPQHDDDGRPPGCRWTAAAVVVVLEGSSAQPKIPTRAK
ncbi:hypothetical protein GCM10009650_16090 [Nesterenkonia jeotgali]